MIPTGNEPVDEVLIPRIEAVFTKLYGDNDLPDLHETLLECVDKDKDIYALNFDEIDNWRAFACNKGHLSLADMYATLSHDIREKAKEFMGEYPYITIENVY